MDCPSEQASPNQGWRVLIIGLAVLLAGWPVVRWIVSRGVDESDEPLGLLALVVALWFLIAGRRQVRVSVASLVAALVVLAGCVSGLLPLPRLLQSAGLFLALGCAFRLWRTSGVALLLLLSVPWVSSMQFYLGYPLRRWAGMCSAALLKVIGVDVSLQGTDLVYEGALVGVDPPCSGVRMLWFALFAAAVLSARFNLRMSRALALSGSAIVLVVFGNGLRAALLFFPESGLITLPDWAHEAAGLLVFALAIWPLFLMAHRWQRRECQDGNLVRLPTNQWILGFVLVCVGVAGLGLVRESGAESVIEVEKPQAWPSTFDGVPVRPLRPGVREEAFAANFPGQIGRFQMGEDELILRRVTRATRLLHSSQDCLRTAGWLVERTGSVKDADSLSWVRFEARRESAVVEVLEQIRDAKGGHTTDVSAWFWRALFHPEEGPWLACSRFHVLR